jgi:hypothetical protein
MEALEILAGIRRKVTEGRYEYAKHAVDQTILRGIGAEEVTEALLSHLELLEDYPEDYYGPSCLVLGFTAKNRPIHVVCSYPSRELIKLITVYEPEESQWLDCRTRRRS